MKDDLLEALADLLRKYKDLMLDDEEIRFICAIVAGYVFSPPSVRAFAVPKFKAVVKEALDMLQRRKAEQSGPKGGEKLPN